VKTDGDFFMARKADYNREEVLADWKTGKYSVRKLADKHRVSPGTIHGIVKNIEKTLEPLINAEVAIKQELATLSERELNTFNNEVDERTKHLVFFSNAAVRNVAEAMETPCESQGDFRQRAETILKGKETALGKQPETAIQINSQNIQSIQPEHLTDEQLASIISRGCCITA